MWGGMLLAGGGRINGGGSGVAGMVACLRGVALGLRWWEWGGWGGWVYGGGRGCGRVGVVGVV